MKKISTLLLLATLIFGSCDSDDDMPLNKVTAKRRVAFLCGTTSSDPALNWFDVFLAQADSRELRGSIYAFKYSGGVAVIHRVDVMSCLPCNVYDCSGNEIQLTAAISQELVEGMKDKNIVYNTSTVSGR